MGHRRRIKEIGSKVVTTIYAILATGDALIIGYRYKVPIIFIPEKNEKGFMLFPYLPVVDEDGRYGFTYFLEGLINLGTWMKKFDEELAIYSIVDQLIEDTLGED